MGLLNSQYTRLSLNDSVVKYTQIDIHIYIDMAYISHKNAPCQRFTVDIIQFLLLS